MAAYSAVIKAARQVMLVDRHAERVRPAEKIGVIPIDDSKGSPVEAVLDLTNGKAAERGCERVGYQAHDPPGHDHEHSQSLRVRALR